MPEYNYVPRHRRNGRGVRRQSDFPTFNQLVATIPVGTSDAYPYPREVAVTPDNSRAYVTLYGSGTVAVIDALSLQEVDVNAGKQLIFRRSMPPTGTSAGLRLEPALDGVLVGDNIDLTGTVNVSNLDTWKLELTSPRPDRSTNSPLTTRISSAKSSPTLDPSGYTNGIYNIKLTATTTTGTSIRDRFWVDIAAKPAIKEIHLPLPAAPYGIAIDPLGTTPMSWTACRICSTASGPPTCT